MSHVRCLAILLCLVVLSQPASAQRAEDAFGTWVHPDNGSHVRMYACGERLCARIARISDKQELDDHNPDPAKRDRPIVGMMILSAKKSAPNKWSGKLYDRSDGKVYSGTVTVNSRGSLHLSGCSMGIFCKNAIWTRVGE